MIRPIAINNMSSIPLIPSLKYERNLLKNGYDWVVGLDEVGRGSLAGPVMVGAAIIGFKQVVPSACEDSSSKTSVDCLEDAEDTEDAEDAEYVKETEDNIPAGLADSKLLTERKREALYDPLKKWCSAYAVGSCTNHDIDDWGIEYALGIAALRAISSAQENLITTFSKNNSDIKSSSKNIKNIKMAAILDGPYDYISKVSNTFDAPVLPISIDVQTLVKADRQCASVAAAAVIAKVTRDHMMVDYASLEKYALYDWDHNKGYGSKAHRQAIAEYGPSDLHRISWHLG